jgi:hypothetical protein
MILLLFFIRERMEAMPETCREKQNICPMTRDPLTDCYFIKWGSQYTTLVMSYCNGNYSECKVYKNHQRYTGDMGDYPFISAS